MSRMKMYQFSVFIIVNVEVSVFLLVDLLSMIMYHRELMRSGKDVLNTGP